jgi:hypothetical protein
LFTWFAPFVLFIEIHLLIKKKKEKKERKDDHI